MPPEVKKYCPEVSVEQCECFLVSLDSKAPFDPTTFDRFALLLKSPEDIDSNFNIKWIVRGDKMIFFPRKTRHAVTNFNFEYRGDKGELKAAGFLGMLQVEKEGYERLIWGSSMDLDGMLGKGVSEKFKLETLPKLLNAEGKECFSFT